MSGHLLSEMFDAFEVKKMLNIFSARVSRD